MRRQTDKESHDLDRLAESVRRLSHLMTRERDRLPGAYLRDPELREAYRTYFLTANLPKVHLPLGELARHATGLLTGERLRVLDIGTGPGTSLLGVLAYFGQGEVQPTLECTAVDALLENLREAEALFAQHRGRYHGQASLRTLHCSAEALTGRFREKFDLIILSNVLNEIFGGREDRIDRRIQLVEAILRELMEETGSCVVIEPALRETSRELLMVRDGLLRTGLHVYAPCLVQTPCPALVHPKDWCHEDRPWNAPEVIHEIDRRVGLRKDSLKFSYLVLRKDGCSIADPSGPGAMRVVSEPLVTKGKREYYCCGPEGRRLVARLEKDAAPANEAFQDLLRGDVVRFEGLLDEEKRFRVAQGTTVIPVFPLRKAGDAS